MIETRVILYHKQATSARTRFLRLAHGGVCGFDPLPAEATLGVIEEEGEPTESAVAAVRSIAERLGMTAAALELHAGQRMVMESEAGEIEVLLARFTATDPPFAEAEAQGGRFIAITEARSLPAVELTLLRQSYEWIMGG